ncbi:MAG: TonB-dependent receptor [Bacteroidetes bacterium]|nr:TonB-dependent receptor [Bacteroidota bacterium]
MRFFLITLVFSLFFFHVAAQKGSIRGILQNAQQEILPGATLQLEHTPFRTVSDLDGRFSFTGIKSGTQKLIVHCLGFQDFEQTLEVPVQGWLDLGVLTLQDNSNTIGGVTVSAKLTQGSEYKANNLMKSSNSYITVISAETMEKLPDRNIAEIVRRAAGVAMQRNYGEGSFINLRGTPVDWTSVTLNGDRLPVSDESDPRRVFQFEVMPSDLLNYVTINRTITPDLEGDNIGGVVNFLNRSSVDRNTLKVSMGMGYSALAQKPIGTGSILLGVVNKAKTLSAVFNGSYFGRNWAEHAYELEYESPYNHGISELKLKQYNGLRQTRGLNAAFEYRPSKWLTLNTVFILGLNTNDKYQFRTNYNWSEGSGSRVRLHNLHGVLRNRFLGANFSAQIQVNDRLNSKLRLASYDNSFRYGNVPYAQGDPRNGYFSVVYISPLLQFYDRDFIDLYGKPADANDPNAFLTKLIGSDNPYGRGDDYRNIQPRYGKFVDGSALTPADFSFYQAISELNTTHEQDPIVVQNDWNYTLNSRVKLIAGLKYRSKTGNRNLSIHKWQVDFQKYPTTPRLLTQSETQYPDPDNNFLAELGKPYSGTFMPFLTRDALNHYVQRLGDTLRNIPMNVLNQEYVLWAGSKYQYTEKVAAGYLMTEAKIGSRLSLVGGIRLEHTHLYEQSDTLSPVAILDTASSTYYYPPLLRITDQSYLAVLPSLNLTWSGSASNNIRVAVSRTFHRPNFAETKPGFANIYYEDLDFTFGNPNLKPTYSINFDLAWEHFWGNKGMFSIGTYYKYVTDHIFLKTTEEYDPIQDIGFKRYANASNSFVWGFECTLNRRFDFLPGIWGGFGVNSNVAWSLSRMSVPGRPASQPMSGQTPVLYNMGLFYEKYGIVARTALNYTGAFLKELNLAAVVPLGGTKPELVHTNTDFDLFQGAFYSLDLSVGYRFNPHFSVYLEASNLLDAPNVDYVGKRERPHRTGYNRQRGQIVAKYAF